ncbi:MAG: hypothetical protein CVU15_03045 [Betaproteobacteria bacterium HGW-Betaproteobacteria-1]|jgi:hypothetical protein|nr:MAG: hypothetical protein CVU15_03045 [Betaproteobacteria bacterium HGW-Betaproteobacteria-1]
MIGSRTCYSLAQFLGLHETDFVVVLLGKHQLHSSLSHNQILIDILRSLRNASDDQLLSLLEEVARTGGDLRARINPKYRYDERFYDLSRCLQLDGYVIEDKKLKQADPSISDAPLLEDDLIEALKASGLSEAKTVAKKINDSSESFRSSPPNYNACLNDIRVSLETLARSIAFTRQAANTPSYDQTKWGAIVRFLRQVEFISHEEEKGLVGVYGFVSPGSHRSLGISEEQMARLGRSLALGMCWFLIKSYQSGQNATPNSRFERHSPLC